MRFILLIGTFLVGMASCKKNPSSSREDDRAVRQTLENKMPEGAIKTPSDPITAGAIRLEVTWQESMPEDGSSLVIVGKRISPGPNYSGHRPESGDPLIIKGLTEAAFEDRTTRIIEVQPPLAEPRNEIPQMTLLKIID